MLRTRVPAGNNMFRAQYPGQNAASDCGLSAIFANDALRIELNCYQALVDNIQYRFKCLKDAAFAGRVAHPQLAVEQILTLLAARAFADLESKLTQPLRSTSGGSHDIAAMTAPAITIVY
jgi:hypothetical protein